MRGDTQGPGSRSYVPRAVVFQARDVIIREGEAGAEAYYIVRGEAEVTKGGQRLATLKGGDYFGEMGLLLNRLRSATVTALTPLVVEVISQDRFEELLQRHPAVGRQLLVQLSARLARISERVAKEQDALGILNQISLCENCAPQVQDVLRTLMSELQESSAELDDWLPKR